MELNLVEDWETRLADEFSKPYYQNLLDKLAREYETQQIYPPKEQIYHALNLTPFDQVKVCILGQDPYHGMGQAHGLAFSVMETAKIPPSLRNIFLELENDIGCSIKKCGTLNGWARQGVLLLNTTLTVREGKPKSHRKIGWELLTRKIIELLSERSKPLVFILWGSLAQDYESIIDTSKHLIIKNAHPSPLSVYRGFYGSCPFSKANAFLLDCGDEAVNWCQTN